MNHVVGEMPNGATVTPPITGGCSGMTQPHVLLCSIP